MKHLKWTATLLLIGCMHCVNAQQGNGAAIALGSGFFYAADSSSSTIYFQPSHDVVVQPKESSVPKVNWPIVEGVQRMGVHSNHILVITHTEKGLRYYHIDKALEAQPDHSPKEGLIKLSNLKKVKKATFEKLKRMHGIEVKPAAFLN